MVWSHIRDLCDGVLWYTLQEMTRLQSIIKLVGFPEYLPATLAATLLGGAAGGGGSLPRIGIAILSNLLLFVFAVIYQKIETAPVAATAKDGNALNPIASGEVSIKFSRTLSAIIVLLCLALAALLGPLNIVLGLLGVLLAIALSHRSLNLGNSVLMRIGKQQTLLSVVFGLSGFLAAAQKLKSEAILLTIFLLGFGFLFAAWTAEKTDRPLSRPLLIILLVFATAAAYLLFIVLEVIPAWAILMMILLGAAIALLMHRFNRHHQSLPDILLDSLAISTAVSLITSYLAQVFL